MLCAAGCFCAAGCLMWRWLFLCCWLLDTLLLLFIKLNLSPFSNFVNYAFLLQNAMETKRNEAQPENEQPVPDTQIVAEVLKEHSSSSTFLSTMGYQSRSGRSRTSASVERVRELEERVKRT